KSMFQVSPNGAVVHNHQSDPRTLQWPSHADENLLGQFKSKGYDKILSIDPIILQGKSGLASAIIIHYHEKYPKSKLEKEHREFAKKRAKLAFTGAGKSLNVVTPFVVYLVKGKWTLKPVGPRIRPLN
ncbi:MAG TPA: hypothetical protein DCW74_20850, partial [Alteromonas australica]|nr:hypothetical protein [Alteromonas australica]